MSPPGLTNRTWTPNNNMLITFEMSRHHIERRKPRMEPKPCLQCESWAKVDHNYQRPNAMTVWVISLTGSKTVYIRMRDAQ